MRYLSFFLKPARKNLIKLNTGLLLGKTFQTWYQIYACSLSKGLETLPQLSLFSTAFDNFWTSLFFLKSVRRIGLIIHQMAPNIPTKFTQVEKIIALKGHEQTFQLSANLSELPEN